MERVIIAHHHEITLKGENRGFFERQLQQNIRRSLGDFLPATSIGGGYGRSIIYLPSRGDEKRILERMTRIFGLANVGIGYKIPQDIQTFCEIAESLLLDRKFETLKVDTRRPDKRFPYSSMEVNRQVGEYLCNRFGVRANLSHPDETIFIELVDGVAYIYRTRLAGLGGLPVGVSGKLVALLSAGFDSPVASWMMMRRGAIIHGVHFHSMPYTGVASVDQVRQLARVLAQYQMRMKLYLVPFADVQQEIVLHSPPPLRIVLYRRMMLRIAESIAVREKAEGLVTGESVGQVASQTLRNIRVIDEAATFPILRPLSGTDKEEIIALARKIGTHDISREPYDDCCSFLAPRNPETKADIHLVRQAEGLFDIPAILAKAIDQLRVEEFFLSPASQTELAE